MNGVHAPLAGLARAPQQGATIERPSHPLGLPGINEQIDVALGMAGDIGARLEVALVRLVGGPDTSQMSAPTVPPSEPPGALGLLVSRLHALHATLERARNLARELEALS